MTPEELQIVIKNHQKWLSGDGGERADLSEANLRRADLSEANLSGANLSGVDLSGADLSGADLDYSAFPLWCGSIGIKCDTRLFAQIAYHMCRLDVPDELKPYQTALHEVAKQFHRFDECGGLPGDGK